MDISFCLFARSERLKNKDIGFHASLNSDFRNSDEEIAVLVQFLLPI